jgi:hypothetical protein
MDEQHHLRRLFFVHSEELHQHIHYKVHGCVVIVQKQNPEARGALEGGLLGSNTDIVLTSWLFVLPLI